MPQVLLILSGALFVLAWALAAGALIVPRIVLPPAIRFTVGAMAVSAFILATLSVRAGYLPVWLAVGGVTIGFGVAFWRCRIRSELPRMKWLFVIVFGGTGAVYLLRALAPEIQPDAITYHLGLVGEFTRLHSFPARLGFYELLPQGIDMLFVPAFAIGQHSAPALVHLAFLVATVPVMRGICRELGVGDVQACAAAAIYFVAPVTAVIATSAYTDAALVCFCCVVVYLAIRWDRERTGELLMLAALHAGFCYAIKPTFGWVALVSLVFFAVRSGSIALAARFAAFAALPILPWIVRSAVLSGNPLAPFLNSWFPNEAFSQSLEADLMRKFSAFRPEFSWLHALPAYTVLGGNDGRLGPAFLLLPLALIAVRSRAGRWLVSAALVLTVPMIWNTSTRFLMPAAAMGAIALITVLPTPAALLLLAVQAVGSAMAMPEIPWRAALRIESEGDYLKRKIPDLGNDIMLEAYTPEDAGILAMAPVHQAYVARDVLNYWGSALADRMVEALDPVRQSNDAAATVLSWHWQAGAWKKVRVTAGSDMHVVEARAGFPGIRPGDVLLAWTHWSRGESFQFRLPAGNTDASLVLWPAITAKVEASTSEGQWVSITDNATATSANIDLRHNVTAFIRRAGYRYILVATGEGGFSEIGNALLQKPAEWGVRRVAHNGKVWLFYISATR